MCAWTTSCATEIRSFSTPVLPKRYRVREFHAAFGLVWTKQVSQNTKRWLQDSSNAIGSPCRDPNRSPRETAHAMMKKGYALAVSLPVWQDPQGNLRVTISDGGATVVFDCWTDAGDE